MGHCHHGALPPQSPLSRPAWPPCAAVNPTPPSLSPPTAPPPHRRPPPPLSHYALPAQRQGRPGVGRDHGGIGGSLISGGGCRGVLGHGGDKQGGRGSQMRGLQRRPGSRGQSRRGRGHPTNRMGRRGRQGSRAFPRRRGGSGYILPFQDPIANEEEGAATSDEVAAEGSQFTAVIQEEKGQANTEEGAAGATWFTGVYTEAEKAARSGEGVAVTSLDTLLTIEE